MQGIKAIALCICLLVAAISVWAQASITVGPNVQVSKANADLEHDEVLVAADPSNAGRLVGCSIIMPKPLSEQAQRTVVYLSVDGGNDWQPSLESPEGTYYSGDPACIYGSDRNAYFTTGTEGPHFDDLKILFYRSRDGGRRWEGPIALRFADREYLAVDQTTGKYAGRVYINGVTSLGDLEEEKGSTAFQLITLTSSGEVLVPAVIRLSKYYIIGMANGVVLSDGTYGVAFGQLNEDPTPTSTKPLDGRIVFVSSTDGGETLSAPVKVSEWHMGPSNYSGIRGGTLPVLAVDQSAGPFRDHLYLVWPEFKDGRGQILFSYSADKGSTWSGPVAVNDDKARTGDGLGPDDFMPVVTVNKASVVGVMWNDRRDNPDNLGYYVRFAASWDGGETFGSSVRVSEAASAFDRGKNEFIQANGGKGAVISAEFAYGYGGFVFIGGHTAGMAADADGVFHPFWVDNRTGVPQIWSTRVTVKGSALRNGSVELATLQDSTGKVTLEFAHPIYDTERQVVSADAYLKNISKDTLKMPLELRVLSLRSPIGEPTLVNPANGIVGAGAILDFSGAVDRGVLSPGERTRPKRVEFRLGNARWPPNARLAASEMSRLLQMNVRVFAEVEPAKDRSEKSNK